MKDLKIVSGSNTEHVFVLATSVGEILCLYLSILASYPGELFSWIL